MAYIKLKTLTKIGNSFLKKQDFQEAIIAFEEINKIKKIPSVLYNLIICHYSYKN